MPRLYCYQLAIKIEIIDIPQMGIEPMVVRFTGSYCACLSVSDACLYLLITSKEILIMILCLLLV